MSALVRLAERVLFVGKPYYREDAMILARAVVALFPRLDMHEFDVEVIALEAEAALLLGEDE